MIFFQEKMILPFFGLYFEIITFLLKNKLHYKRQFLYFDLNKSIKKKSSNKRKHLKNL